jgi:hypothetical protein
MERTQVTSKGKTLFLTASQKKFKAKKIFLTKNVHVYSFMGKEILWEGTELICAPLYPTHPGTALNSEGTEVNVKLSKGTSCWIPEGHWEISQ